MSPEIYTDKTGKFSGSCCYKATQHHPCIFQVIKTEILMMLVKAGGWVELACRVV